MSIIMVNIHSGIFDGVQGIPEGTQVEIVVSGSGLDDIPEWRQIDQEDGGPIWVRRYQADGSMEEIITKLSPEQVGAMEIADANAWKMVQAFDDVLEDPPYSKARICDLRDENGEHSDRWFDSGSKLWHFRHHSPIGSQRFYPMHRAEDAPEFMIKNTAGHTLGVVYDSTDENQYFAAGTGRYGDTMCMAEMGEIGQNIAKKCLNVGDTG